MRVENRSEIIHDALNLLDDEMIEEVEQLRENKKTQVSWRKWTALAASVCVLVIVGNIWSRSTVQEFSKFDVEKAPDVTTDDPADYASGDENDTVTTPENEEEAYSGIEDYTYEETVSNTPSQESAQATLEAEAVRGIEIPAMEVDLGKEDGIASDMMAFFIHEGRCYVQNEYIKDGAAFVGDHAGTSVGLIAEWTTEDGYVDGAGSIGGDFYEVEGIDPEFMLCMKYENGAVETFVHNNGITLAKGSNLLVDRLHLTENLADVGFLNYYDWNYTQKEPTMIYQENKALLERFLDSFNEAQFMYTEATGFNDEKLYNNDAVYHLYFYTTSGVRVQFWIFEDGYVAMHGLNQVCVQIDEVVYEELITVLESTQ